MANALEIFEKKYPQVVERGIKVEQWNTLKNSMYAGAKDDSILMLLDYCKAKRLDPMTKCFHIVPMSVKGQDGKYVMKDTIMAGIDFYRIQAGRAGTMAGSTTQYGDMITAQLGSESVTYPEWVEVTTRKIMGERIVEFTAREYWLEAYASKSSSDETPNKMWLKRSQAMLEKCAEMQSLRKAFPEAVSEPSYEQMVGQGERDITPIKVKKSLAQQLMAPIPEPDMAWFDLLMESISSATQVEELGALYEMGSHECKAHKNTEALEHIATACRQKEEHLLTVKEEKNG